MQHVDSETVAIQKFKVYYIELRMLHRCTHSAFVFEEICDRFDVMSERRNRWNSNRNGIDTLDDDDDGDVAQHVCLCLAHGIWLVYEHMNRLFTPFCNVNYAFIAATMNPQCICSTTQSIYSGWLVCLAAIHCEPIYRLPNQTVFLFFFFSFRNVLELTARNLHSKASC